MPQTKQVVFLMGRSGTFQLRDDIKSFGFEEKLGQYYVKGIIICITIPTRLMWPSI